MDSALIDNLFENLILPRGCPLYAHQDFEQGFLWALTVAMLFLSAAVSSQLFCIIMYSGLTDKTLAKVILDHMDTKRELGDDTLAMGLQHGLDNPKAFCLGASLAFELGAQTFQRIPQPERGELYAGWRAEFDAVANAYYGVEVN